MEAQVSLRRALQGSIKNSGMAERWRMTLCARARPQIDPKDIDSLERAEAAG
jgi:hypothetical protein